MADLTLTCLTTKLDIRLKIAEINGKKWGETVLALPESLGISNG